MLIIYMMQMLCILTYKVQKLRPRWRSLQRSPIPPCCKLLPPRRTNPKELPPPRQTNPKELPPPRRTNPKELPPPRRTNPKELPPPRRTNPKELPPPRRTNPKELPPALHIQSTSFKADVLYVYESAHESSLLQHKIIELQMLICTSPCCM